MRVPKKHPKNLSKNRFWKPFWPPKPLQNRRKIEEKTMLKQDSKKTPKNCQHDTNKKTCLSKEREERISIRVVVACNPTPENLKLVSAKLSRQQKAAKAKGKPKKITLQKIKGKPQKIVKTATKPLKTTKSTLRGP